MTQPEWKGFSADLAREPRPSQTPDSRARYYGFCAPNGDVRPQDRDAFARAIEAPWRRL